MSQIKASISPRRMIIATFILCASCAWGQGPGPSGARVTAIAQDAIARVLIGDVAPEAVPPAFEEPVVTRRYVDASGALRGTLMVGIYADPAAAARAFQSMQPQISRSRIEAEDREGWTTASGAVVRFHNAILGIAEPGSNGVGVSVERQRSMLEKLAELVDDPRLVRRGATVDIPRVEVMSMTRIANVSAEDSITVVVRQPAPDARRTLVRPQAKAMVNEQRELRVKRRLLEGETILRVARPTGEVAEVRLNELETRGMVIADPPVPRLPSLSVARKDALIAGLGATDSIAASASLAELANHADESMLPVFRDALAGDRPGAVKQHALRGLAALRGADGLDAYVALAQDVAQPEILRIDAARLIAKYGGSRAHSMLNALETEAASELGRTIERLLARLSRSLGS